MNPWNFSWDLKGSLEPWLGYTSVRNQFFRQYFWITLFRKIVRQLIKEKMIPLKILCSKMIFEMSKSIKHNFTDLKPVDPSRFQSFYLLIHFRNQMSGLSQWRANRLRKPRIRRLFSMLNSAGKTWRRNGTSKEM